MERPLRVHLSVVPGRGHNLYNELTEAPPEGVEYLFPAVGETGFKPARQEKAPLVQRVQSSPAFRAVYGPLHRNLLGGVGVQERLARLRGRRSAYDVYHSLGHVHPLPEPWVVSPETSLDFFGFGNDWHVEIRKASSRRWVARKLLSPHCKRILPWNGPSMRSLEKTFPDAWPRLQEKTEVVPHAIRAGPEPPAEPAGPPWRALFVGSRNFPQDFLPKGGQVAMEAHRLLRERRPDVELVVRAKVPDRLRAKYADVPGLRIIEEPLSDAELEALYHGCHVFVFPASHTPGMVIPEAMRAGRPVVAFDVWANPESVRHGKTGLLVAPPEGIEYVNDLHYPTWSHEDAFLRPFEENAGPAAGRVADAIERLLDDGPLRRAMGAAARREVTEGRFSVARRNAALRRVYEEAARR